MNLTKYHLCRSRKSFWKQTNQISCRMLTVRHTCLFLPASFQIEQQDLFDEWVSKLRHHRIYRRSEIASFGKTFSRNYPLYQCPNSPSMSNSVSIRKVWTYSTRFNDTGYCFLILCATYIKKHCHCVNRHLSLLLQPMLARRQSSMHAEAAFPVTCSSQVRVAAWLQSSEDMDRCSQGEGPDLWHHWRLSCDSLPLILLMLVWGFFFCCWGSETI